MLPFCEEHEIGFLPFSPLGRGFLTGDIERSTSFSKEDFRLVLPRFRGEALSTNFQIVDRIKEVAGRQATPAQIALAWALAQGEHVVPIPGSAKRSHLEQNVAAANIRLTAADLDDLDALPTPVGSRYRPQKGRASEEARSCRSSGVQDALVGEAPVGRGLLGFEF